MDKKKEEEEKIIFQKKKEGVLELGTLDHEVNRNRKE